jgi:hypothetical protein
MKAVLFLQFDQVARRNFKISKYNSLEHSFLGKSIDTERFVSFAPVVGMEQNKFYRVA